MTSKDFQGDFTDIMETLKCRMGITNAIIRRLEGDELKTVAYFGYNEKEACLRIFVGQGVSGRCAKEARTIIVNDLEQYDGQYISGIDGAKSELCVPLARAGTVVGTLNVESTSRDNFTHDKIDIAERIAAMLVHSVANPENQAGRSLARALALLEKNSPAAANA